MREIFFSNVTVIFKILKNNRVTDFLKKEYFPKTY